MQDGLTGNGAAEAGGGECRTDKAAWPEPGAGEEWIALLAELKLEATPEADFEARFLYDLHERIAQEAVCRPARKLLWEHILQMLTNIGGRKIAYGASTLGLGALAVGFFSWPSAEESALAVDASAVASSLEKSMASLKPGKAKDFTCISVAAEKRRSFTRDQLAMQDTTRFFEQQSTESQDNSVTSPVNMGLSDTSPSPFPSWTASFSH